MDDIFDSAIDLVYFKPTASYEDYKKSINMISNHLGELIYDDDRIRYLRSYVKHNDVLKQFVSNITCTLTEENLCAMISRCIEHNLKESLEILINYKNIHHSDKHFEIKLLPTKYIISNECCVYAKENNIYDSYYNNPVNRNIYHHNDTCTKESMRIYSGYRDAYHTLLYGNKTCLLGLLKRWTDWEFDCTFDAAKDYFQNESQEYIIEQINKIVNEEH